MDLEPIARRPKLENTRVGEVGGDAVVLAREVYDSIVIELDDFELDQETVTH